MTNYFFISSPLHFFIATNLAIAHKNETNIAVFISKNKKTAQQYAKASLHFKEIFQHCFDLTETNTGNKQADRKQSFINIKAIFATHTPHCIFTGNDRRVEFQYAMYHARSLNKKVQGIYMDDGAISYLGHKSLNKFTHKYIDPLLKKLFYGFWWQNPLTTGTSNWVSAAYLAFPEYAHPLLKAKKLHALDQAIFASEQFRQVNHFLTESYQELNTIDFSTIKAVLCLPYESLYLADEQFIRQIKSYLSSQYKDHEIAIKAHPRSKNLTLLDKVFTDNIMLPNTLGMELLLTKLSQGCCVFGDVSTTLLTTKWLRPELKIQALALASNKQAELKKLFGNLSIEFITL